MRILKNLLWTIPSLFAIHSVSAMFLIILESTYVDTLFAKILFTLGLLSFFCLTILATIDRSENQQKTN